MTEEIKFGRQPQPVTVTLEGEIPDVAAWFNDLKRFCERKGDMVDAYTGRAESSGYKRTFRIYPRAVND